MPDDDFDSDDPVDEVVQTPEEELEKEKKKAVALDSLMTAVRFGIQSQVTELLEENRDLVNMMDEHGHGVVHWASKKGDVEMLHLIHRYGAKLDIVTEDDAKMYPIHWAAREGRLAALRFLVQSGCDMNVQDKNGCTPIVFAAQHNKLVAVVFLWKNGADMNITDSSGDTAHHWAAYKGYSELMGLLYHINPHAISKEDNYGQTPVHLAAMRGNEDVLTFLLDDCRASTTSRDHNGHTPLELAIKKSHLNCELVLRKFTGASTLDILRQIGFDRIKKDGRMVSSLFCAANEREMTNWPWRIVFVSNFIASLVTIRNITDPMLLDLSLLHICNAIVQSIWWFCFTMCLFQSPSLVKDNVQNYNDALDDIGNAVTEDNLPNVCHSCRVRKPLRSKHCKIKRRCINKFDHYCPFVGNAVGRDNYLYFCSLLLCHMVAGTLWLITVGYLYRRTTISWTLLFFALYSFGWMFMLAGLLQYHTYLLTMNMTTNEHVNASRYTYLKNDMQMFDNPFSKGSSWANIIDGLFPEPIQFFSREEALMHRQGRGPEDKAALLV